MKNWIILLCLVPIVAGCKHTADGAQKDLAEAQKQVDAARRDATKQAGSQRDSVSRTLDDASKAINKAGQDVSKQVGRAADQASKQISETAQHVGTEAKKAYEKGKDAVDVAVVRLKIEAAILRDNILSNKNNQIEVVPLATKIVLNGMVLTEDMKKLASVIAKQILTELNADLEVENNLVVPGR